MMNKYHNAIMNLQIHPKLECDYINDSTIEYKRGHRDARHAAAEIALDAETKIDELTEERDALRAENERLREAVWHELRRVGVDDYGNPVPAVGFDSRLYRALTKSVERGSNGGAS